MPKFSASKENHLKAIYHLQEAQGQVTTNALAAALQTRPASVTDMLKKLKKEKLLRYEKYKGFRLSAEGKKVALLIIRKHRLWEYFLVERLHFGWDEVHAIAEELEHIESKKLIDRLDEYLLHPQTDPHGDPIPDRDGNIKPIQKMGLSSLPLHTPARVCSIGNQSPEMLELLTHKNIGLGTWLCIEKKFLIDQSLDLKISEKYSITISEQVAKNIFVHYEEQNP